MYICKKGIIILLPHTLSIFGGTVFAVSAYMILAKAFDPFA